jgi:arabinofuranosyltransferase
VLTRLVQNPAAVVTFFVFSGLLQAAYWIRQGGDFMHGRVLLAPLFCLLAPVAVIPIVLPDATKYSRGTENQLAGFIGLLWFAVVGWSLSTNGASTLRPPVTRTR